MIASGAQVADSKSGHKWHLNAVSINTVRELHTSLSTDIPEEASPLRMLLLKPRPVGAQHHPRAVQVLPRPLDYLSADMTQASLGDALYRFLDTLVQCRE